MAGIFMTKTKKIILSIICVVFFVTATLIAIFIPKPKGLVLDLNQPLGVWWWDKTLGDKYLNFAQNNNVDEIYYCDSSFSQSTQNFIKKARAQNIKVYLLAGEKEWLEDNSNLISLVDNYIEYNSENNSCKFSGIHLDIEPHQFDNFKLLPEDSGYTPPPAPFEDSTWREYYFYKLVDVAYFITTSYPDIRFDFDIPFWADDLVIYGGTQKPVYQHIIDLSYRTFIMSYRDSAEKTISVASDELAYAKAQNKTIFLGAETSLQSEEIVSYYEEGKKEMYNELDKLKSSISQDYGIAIHHIKSWYNLKK